MIRMRLLSRAARTVRGRFFCFGLLSVCLTDGWVSLAAEDPNQPARTLVHLLDYIAVDYSGAVAEGKIISPEEYEEMIEFSESAGELRPIFFDPLIETETQKQLAQLKNLVAQKAHPNQVAALARHIKSKVLRGARLPVAPTRWPDRAQARKLYQANCAACHGTEGHGDGPAGAALSPKPTSFHDHERMQGLSPFQAFNTISLGLAGTGMASFSQLPEEDLWALAFYVVSLRHQKSPHSTAAPRVPLAEAASLSDAQLIETLPGLDEDKKSALAALRLWSAEADPGSFLGAAISHLDSAVAAYKAGDLKTAKQKALLAYLEGIEPVEPRLKALKPSAVIALEKRMGAVREAIESRQSQEAVAATAEQTKEAIFQAQKMVTEGSLSPALIFSMAMAIILREGFEAVLVIIAILGVLQAVEARRAAHWVHAGWMAALAAGAISWWASDRLLGLSGLRRELIEGFISLSAVGILLYLGFWLHSKTEIGRWKIFIESKVSAALKAGNLWGLAIISFLAVFREAFETVLFLSALGLEGGHAGRAAMGSGAVTAIFAVLFLAVILLRFSARLPIRTLFGLSASLMGVLAIVLTGKGLHSLQETGWISVTAAPFSFRWDLAGLYPTVETLLVQGIILALTAALWVYGRRPSPAAVASCQLKESH